MRTNIAIFNEKEKRFAFAFKFSLYTSNVSFTSCILLHHNPVHIPLLLAEVHAHLYQAFPVQRIGNEVAFLIYLLQGIHHITAPGSSRTRNGPRRWETEAYRAGIPCRSP